MPHQNQSKRRGVLGALFLLPLLAAEHPFWASKAPADWSMEEVTQLLRSSPWAAISTATAGPPLRAHIASAAPMREAEARERQALRFRIEPGASFLDYQELLSENKYIALAVLLKDAIPTSDGEESKSLEHDSVLHIGRRTYKLVTYFPPTGGDPYLRYIFPREIRANDKSLLFDLYIPGVIYPQRHFEFDLKGMSYQGKLAY